MKRWAALGVTVAVVMVAVTGCAALGERFFAQQALTTGPNGTETPASLGAPFERASIPSRSRRLDAYLVRAPADCRDPPALLIYHGFNETISYWAAAQAFLYQHCVSSLVFDPTGSGDSSRPASLQRINEDAVSAYAYARSRFGSTSRFYVLGHSMGNAILLQAEPSFSPQPSGVVVANGFSSLRDFWAAHGANTLVAHAIPDWWDNVQAIQAVHVPVMVIHSDTDKMVPLPEAQQVFAAAGQPKTLTIVHGFAHNGLRRHPTEDWWGRVLSFVHSPGVSRTPLAPPPIAADRSHRANEDETAREEKVRMDAIVLSRSTLPDHPPPPGVSDPLAAAIPGAAGAVPSSP